MVRTGRDGINFVEFEVSKQKGGERGGRGRGGDGGGGGRGRRMRRRNKKGGYCIVSWK